LLIGRKYTALQGEVADDLTVVGIKFGDYIGLKILEGAGSAGDPLE